MDYRLKPQTGDTLAVPQLVLSRLEKTDGDTMRVALYLLRGGSADPAQIARDLCLKNTRTAENALQFWAGAGLLERGQAAPLPQKEPPDTTVINEAMLRDPVLSDIIQEVQMHFGRVPGHGELQRLAALYLDEQYPADVIALCCSYLATQDKRTVGKLAAELNRWREAGVETGADAERYLEREKKRRAREAEVAPLFGLKPEDLTMAQKRAIHSWVETWHFDLAMIQEALLHAGSKNTIRYVGGILRSWHAQGFTRPAQVQGSGALQGSNIQLTAAAQKQPSGAIQGVFRQDWNASFDD